MLRHIYSLHDPDTNECYYIGKTTNFVQRYKKSLWPSNQAPVALWIKSLRPRLPNISFYEECSTEEESVQREQYWIDELKPKLNVSRASMTGGTVFSAEQLSLLGPKPDYVLADLWMLPKIVVSKKRRSLNIKPYRETSGETGVYGEGSRPGGNPGKGRKAWFNEFSEAQLSLIGTGTDKAIADFLGVTERRIRSVRNRLGIKPFKEVI